MYGMSRELEGGHEAGSTTIIYLKLPDPMPALGWIALTVSPAGVLLMKQSLGQVVQLAGPNAHYLLCS